MKTRDKVLLTILLAVMTWLLFGCGSQEHFVSSPTLSKDSDTNLAYLRQLFDVYNEGYFHRSLLPPEITIDDSMKKYMAVTQCDASGALCNIKFNLLYVRAPRVANFTMLHEMCHIKTWNDDRDFMGSMIDHGKHWRGCMLELDAEGAFREIIIDDYELEGK